ncbi:stage III sporulation protein AB [Clostridiaceae bacterium WCA-383-APC-5B]|uniref:Stage III sporulation protein AB n=2 Tax=Inconstantimicrobium porci TaxID=2652291 RepID=A0A7X2MWM1_9CLOT|nr:stage III sporulation protein AB [Inconstantimicrobium porci]
MILEKRRIYSMIIKIFILIMIVILSTLIGFQYSENAKYRVKHLKGILNSIVYLQNEIFYRLTPLSEAMNLVSQKVDPPVSDLFNDIAINLNDERIYEIKQAFIEAIKTNKNEFSLEKEDFDILVEFSRSLGTTDLDGQMKIFDMAVENLKNNLKSASDKADKNIKMYRTLGLCIGLMIAIFLI